MSTDIDSLDLVDFPNINYNEIREVMIEKTIVSLTVYPNPSTDIVNVTYTNYLLKETLFNIYDLTGRLVKTKKYVPQHTGTQKFSIDVNNLKAGTYFYTLQVGEESYNGKVVKMEF